MDIPQEFLLAAQAVDPAQWQLHTSEEVLAGILSKGPVSPAPSFEALPPIGVLEHLGYIWWWFG